MRFKIEMECIVLKTIIVECESKEIARDNPWDHAIDEIETNQVDWEILSVSPEKE